MKFTVALALCLLAQYATAASTGKISVPLQRSLQSKGRVNIYVSMTSGIDTPLAAVSQSVFRNRGEQATAVFKSLSSHAEESQKNVLAFLNSPRVFALKVQSFWISNQIYVQGADKALIESLAAMDEVSTIEEEILFQLDDPFIHNTQNAPLAEWGIDKIRAADAWATGANGNGALIGIIDTGARHTHEAIRSNYRGGTHSWYDPYNQAPEPTDRHGHGTHVTGTIAGSNDIGVAPGAKWISCKGIMDSGGATLAGFLACGQFMACPHNSAGSNPDCSLAPHAVSNSWTFAGFEPAIRSWHAAGIIPIFALGNSGSSCSSTVTPGNSPDVIGVAASTISDTIATFSSRGPAPGGLQKPDVSAPGQDVRSAGISSDTAYTSMSGTSMACPHVAGLVALLKGKNPQLNYASVKQILESTADRNVNGSGQTCNGVPDSQFPNYVFGYGRINALSAVGAV